MNSVFDLDDLKKSKCSKPNISKFATGREPSKYLEQMHKMSVILEILTTYLIVLQLVTLYQHKHRVTSVTK